MVARHSVSFRVVFNCYFECGHKVGQMLGFLMFCVYVSQICSVVLISKGSRVLE